MFIEGTCEVDAEQLAVVHSQTHHPPSETEVAQVVRVDVGMTVWLESCSCRDKRDCKYIVRSPE